MAKDQLGLSLAGSDASARAYDRAVSDYWGLTGDPVGALKQALADDPAFALGAAAIAGLFLIGGFRSDHPEVAGALAAAERELPNASPREKLHVAAVRAWAKGRSIDATLIWEAILVDWPTDALALRFAQDAYFFLGQSQAIRNSAARVLPAWDRGHPLTSFVLGAYAFGLEETGELARAEERAREALALNPRDAWATHALAHVFETACRPEDGIAFLKSTRETWTPAHFMAGHNGWHLALYLIEQGGAGEVLADYDRFAAPKLADDMTLDRCDAAALLWRLELAGVDVGDRWGPVARAWRAHADDHVLAFNATFTRRSRRPARPTARTQPGSGARSTPTSAMAAATTGRSPPRSGGGWSRACSITAPARTRERSRRSCRRAPKPSASAAATPSATSST